MEQIVYFFERFVFYHPISWLIRQSQGENLLDISVGPTKVLTIFGIAVWFGLTRYFAEAPGNKHGFMYVWWIIFSLFHIWGYAFYYIFDIFAGQHSDRSRRRRDAKYGEIPSGSGKGKPPV
ncbi:MAG TPA: hypothetical protein VGB30_12065 [bacterium]